MSITFSILAILILPFQAFSEKVLDTRYHLYVDNKHIGETFDKEQVDSFLDGMLEEKQALFPNLSLSYENDIKWTEEKVVASDHDEDIDTNELKDNLKIITPANAIVVNDQLMGYLSPNITKEIVANLLSYPYLQSNDKLMNNDIHKDLNELPVGESWVQDIEVSPSIEFVETTISPDQLISLEKLIAMMLEDSGEGTYTYTIQKGDVLGTIAEKFNLKIDELLQLNPNLTEDGILQVGDKIKVKGSDPFIDVTLKRVKRVEETIEFETITKEDKSLQKGETYVEREGKNGKKEVIYEVTSINDQVKTKDIISENIIEEKVDKIIVKGTKESPSIGTGKFVWPTIGGTVTSYQGMRWGKLHKGIDIAGVKDRSILAADNGTVTFTGWINGYGNTVKIDHNNGYTTQYAHLSSVNVKEGQIVSKGSKIGVMGSTGFTTGVTLDFEVYKNNKLVNPIDVLPKR